MTGEDSDVGRKHHRSPDDGVEEGSKLRKHSHHRSSHRHHRHSSKHKHETKQGEDSDVRRKHHRSPDDGVEEGSKLRKHSHHRSSHRHHRHSSKHKHETKREEDYRVAADVDLKKKKKKKRDSDAESGEIMSEDVAVGKSGNRNPGMGKIDESDAGYKSSMSRKKKGDKRGRSRSPLDKGDADSRKHRKIDDDYTSVRQLSSRHLELMDNGRNGLGNRRTSMSLDSRGNKYKSVSCFPSYNRYNDEPQIRKISMSRDHVRERYVSQSTLQEGRVHHHEQDVKSYSDTNDRGKTSDSREKAKDRHDSRDPWDWDREKEIGREKERVRDRNRDKSNGRDRERDRDSYRGRDRNGEREREMERSRDGYKDFRHSKHDESDYHFEKIRSQGSAKVSSNRNGDSEVSGENLKRDVDEQDDYEERVELKLAHQEEEVIDRIKQESRKRRQAILEKYKQQQSQQQSERSEYMFCDDIFGESPAGVRKMVKTDVVVGTDQPAYSSPFQFGSFGSMPPNPPNPKQTQPHPIPTVQSHSKPNTKGLLPTPKRIPPSLEKSHLILFLSWGRGLRSTSLRPIEAVPQYFQYIL